MDRIIPTEHDFVHLAFPKKGIVIQAKGSGFTKPIAHNFGTVFVVMVDVDGKELAKSIINTVYIALVIY